MKKGWVMWFKKIIEKEEEKGLFNVRACVTALNPSAGRGRFAGLNWLSKLPQMTLHTSGTLIFLL